MKKLIETRARGIDLLGTYLVNIVFAILTLGIYHFWGRVRIRRYLWGVTLVDRDPFIYRGRGIELLLGFGAGLLVLVLPLLFLVACLSESRPSAEDNATIGSLLGLYLIVLRPFLNYRSLRYAASRTTLKGIRFAVVGSALSFALNYLMYSVICVVTLGLAYPFLRVRCWRLRIGQGFYGSEQFSTTARASELFLIWFVCLVLAIPTLAMSIVYYRAFELRYLISSTRFQGLQIGINASSLDLILFRITTWLLLVLSLGIAYPWVVARRLNRWADWLTISGEIDYQRIRQEAHPYQLLGDGVLEVELAV